MTASIQDRVLKVIATTRRLPIESVTPDSTFEELGVDSLDRLNILFDLEGEFDIEIDDEEAKSVTNLHQMIDGVTQLVNAKAARDAAGPTEPDAGHPEISETRAVEKEGEDVRPAQAATTHPAGNAPAGEPMVPLDPAVLPAPFHDPSETED